MLKNQIKQKKKLSDPKKTSVSILWPCKLVHGGRKTKEVEYFLNIQIWSLNLKLS